MTNARAVGGVADTALWTAAARARESRRADRLFSDPFAEVLAGPTGVALLQHFHTEHAADDGNPFLPIRTRWFDDTVVAAIAAPGGPRQVVGIGAGLDSRAFRLAWPTGTVLFELDQPALLDYKADRLAPLAPEPRCERRVVPANLGGGWTGALRDAGFDPARPTLWFAEGVLFYLPEALAAEVVRAMAALSAPGSRLAADLVGLGVFRLPYTRPFLRKLADAGSPWQFGTDDPAGFVRANGWADVTVLEPGRPDADFGRWPAGANPVNLPGLPRSFLVSAVRGTP
ncbi:SAM-dependent methyltransferase [Dactylosporangium sp. AC04546]|uniref:class I SAM-dependent methyltransferase n=1 Tax=Dactylosporangium sp. AC04546 TaxID=2862460 RepID=UPI001EDF49C6|nr:SAM-dependent methyltransferase [Dactylosporangium sp. AC04546]WVK81316.1 SAM-dependent methyltransferase [Dactylosporangium sp. AC04546]